MNKISIQIDADVKRALLEDVGTGDVTAELLPPNLQVRAEIISREPMLVCGQAWVNEVFKQLDDQIKLEWGVAEGVWLDKPSVLCTLHGPGRSILTGERTALNFLQTLSATASQTYHYVQKLRGTQTRILDTRKTIPGLRAAQKYAVTCGGGLNHRMGLYDAVLIKENHIAACGSVGKAVALARQNHKNILVEVEVETLEELHEALAAQPDRIMLDNFSEEMLEKAVKMNQPKRCTLEVSGGITLENIAAIGQLGVDFISVGAITKSIQAIDLSLLIRKIL
ncbi:carboxylating nicotinate-nucleotide diphosphorylase [Fluoribacter dumoffii]|uniref:nicotinate-nucleotide diphosphorylase (carboxylating) n=1 Tax=Fluoribacter dumoffii TaxID=463 RepID=A0A377GBM9_9GAMM|nr:carboxylating nicotinate-nucleotide diphosphorylase [Fluoribacter dumoffii]KTC88631.1 nicotinate-nucleotide pyrophosphorylase [Fluoribacter dumoffii NY 23]MCW8386077.1 carboxylating nicotinate-nucleotide diphosphorylase [Fluoribacter dumoffii]MCW8419129.1 carboxylating nicotinate-nucleotide diphosphorylase [Fluoribacter dumoffii]MCW8453027.1 carboxylating nicotinate-nucleotide diphosphorylase [Fluoribacter dumoffii]MCW8459755.1 carboxylating nicotinate-nucleotide diphosphorylase [Fluoribact